MSGFGDALKALKNVVLLQERLDRVREDVSGLAGDVDGLNEYAVSIDKRVIRIETMIEMTQGQAAQKRLDSE